MGIERGSHVQRGSQTQNRRHCGGVMVDAAVAIVFANR